jgi:hypothetical protein
MDGSDFGRYKNNSNDYDRLHSFSCFIRLGPDKNLVDEMVYHTIVRF